MKSYLSLFRFANLVGKQHVQHSQNAVVVLSLRSAKAEHDDGQRIVIPDRFRRFLYCLLFYPLLYRFASALYLK